MSQDEEYLYIPTITQQKIISLLVIVPSLLSFFGSSLIIYHITNDKRKSPYRRLLLGMSMFDIVSTFGWLAQPYLMPSNVINSYVWSFGNETSCKASAAFGQTGVAAHLYNGCLSIYFLLTIRFGMREKTFEKRLEKVMHFVVITFAVGTSVIGLVTDMYYPMHIGPGCWISHPPEGDICANDSCGAGKMGWAFAGFPALLCIFTISVSNLILYCYVMKTVKRGQARCNRTEATEEEDDENEDGIMRKPSLGERLSGKFSGRSSGRSTSSDREWQRVKQLGNQSFLYVGSYFLCFIWTVLKGALDGEGFDNMEGSGSIFLPVLVLQSVLTPIHGFFSMLIYFRPKILKNRKEFPQETTTWAFRRAVLGDCVKPEQKPRHRRGVTVSDNVSNSGIPGNQVKHTRSNESSNETGQTQHMVSISKRILISSLTASVGDFDAGKENGGKKLRPITDLPKGAFEVSPGLPRLQFQSSLDFTGRSLQSISELTESVFDPIMNLPNDQDGEDDSSSDTDPLESSERRWISSAPISVSPRRDASRTREQKEYRIDDQELQKPTGLVAPLRMESDHKVQHHIDERVEEIDDVSDSGNYSEIEFEDICDTPATIPLRKLSMRKSLESSRSFHSGSSISSSCSLISLSEEDLEFGEGE